MIKTPVKFQKDQYKNCTRSCAHMVPTTVLEACKKCLSKNVKKSEKKKKII